MNYLISNFCWKMGGKLFVVVVQDSSFILRKCSIIFVVFVRLPMTWSGWWGAGKRLAVTSGRSTEERPLTPKKSPCQRRVTCVTCREEVRSDDFFWNRMAFMYCLQQVSYTTHYNELASIQSPAGCRLCRPYRGDRCCGSVQVQSVAL